ncbi:MAG: hypothetical protein ACLU6Y_14315 [Ruminococcus sp.]
MMNKLLDLGMGVYLTSSTNWASSNVPVSELDPTSSAAMQIIASVMSQFIVRAVKN